MASTVMSPMPSKQETNSPNPSLPSVSAKGDTENTLIGGSKSETQHDVVGFISDGKVQDTQFDRPENLTDFLSLLKAGEDREHGIREFMARPVKVADIRWTTGDVGAIVHRFNIMNTLRSHKAYAPVREKLYGFFGFTATASCKVVVNAQPMEAGIFSINFAPQMKEYERDQFNVLVAQDTLNPTRLPFGSGLPCKIVNVAKHSEATLSVGYVGPDLFLNLLRNSDFGDFFIQNVCPLTSGQSGASANIAVYMSFSDVVLYGATRKFDAQADDLVVPSVQTPAKEATSEEEVKVSDLAEKLGSIPLLAEMQPEAAFALKAGGNLARQFGFSKPVASANHERVAITPFGQPANADGTSNATKLGLSVDQGVVVMPMGPTEVDEMAFSYVLKEPNFLHTITWDSSTENEQMIAWLPAEPNCMVFNGNNYYPPRLYYVSEMFSYWRGSINFTFHVAATKFHSGRLRFVYDVDSTSTPAKEDVFARHYGRVVDIRDGMSFTISVPYMATTPWRQVPREWAPSVTEMCFVTHESKQSGLYLSNALYVYVENFLRGPDTVAQSVQIAVYVSAGDDFELAVPMIRNTSFYNRSNDSPALVYEEVVRENAPPGIKKKRKGLVKRLFQTRKAVAQSVDDHAASIDDIPVFSVVSDVVKSSKPQLMASKLTIGEKFVSLRQLCKRMQAIGMNNGDAKLACILPFEVAFSGNYDSTWAKTYLERVMVLYRFWRGGMRFVVAGATSEAQGRPFFYQDGTAFRDFQFKGDTHFGKMCPVYAVYNAGGNDYIESYMLNQPDITSFPIRPDIQGGVDVEFPFYSNYPFCRYDPKVGTTTADHYIRQILLGNVPMGVGVTKIYSQDYIYRAAADDFQCGYLLGAPVCRSEVDFTYRPLE